MNSKKHIQWLSLLIVFLVFFSFGQSAWAQTTYYSRATGDWDNVNTWSTTTPAGVAAAAFPVAGDIVNIELGFTVTIPAGVSAAAASIDIDGTSTLVMTGAAPTLTLTGGLNIDAGGTFTASAVSGATNIIIGGAITNAGTITTSNETILTLNGTVDTDIPDDILLLRLLTINKGVANVVSLTNGLTVGNGTAGGLTIAQGKLDLDGNNITLATAAVLSEANTYQIINTGNSSATEGYITTPTILGSAANATGIGVTSITPAASNYVIRRYVIPTATPISVSGVGSAIDRVYRISTTLPTAITLQFDNTEVNSLITDLSLYTSTALTMSSPVEQNSTGDANRTIGLAAGKSTVAYSSFNGAVALDNYYTLASEDLAANTKVFTGLNSVNWNDAGNWNPSGIPLATDNVLIPSGKAVTVDAGAVCDDITITDATATVANGITLDINGNLTLNGTSALTAATATSVVTFTGAAVQTITVAEDSYCEFGDLTINNAGNGVTTASNITMRDLLTTSSGAFTQTAGTFTFNPLAASNLWAATGAITLNDVILNIGGGATPATPATGITINGDFTKIGAGLFTASAGTVTFTNTNLAGKTIQVAGGVTTFFNLAVSAGSKIATASSFSLAGTGGAALTIASNAELVAEAGTITITGAAALISNSGTLEFNNLVNDGAATATASSFTIKGNFTNAAGDDFDATAGTITFENTTTKTILNTAANATTLCEFWNIVIAEGSSVTGATPFSITGNLTLEANSELDITALATTFDGTTLITVDDTALLNLFNVALAATAAVTTSDDITISGTAWTTTSGGTFIASDGNVTIDGALVITSPDVNDLVFYDLTIDDVAVNLVADNYLEIKGDFTINGATGNFTAAQATGATGYVTFSGTSQQLITGTTTNTPTITRLQINKLGSTTAEKTVLMEIPVLIRSHAQSDLDLTSGIINLGSETLTIGLGAVSTTGASHYIDGGTGTLVLGATAASLTLSDPLFNTTLYNLTVQGAETVDGSLTVNGKLLLDGADLTYTGQTLTLKGDLEQTNAGADQLIHGNTGILVLDGSGTVIGGLSNDFFSTSNVDGLVIKRGEILGDDLTFTATAATFAINTSTQYLDIDSHILTFDNATVLQRLSGGIDADAGTVVFGTDASQTTIPANLFKNNIVNNITISTSDVTLGGDLTINGTLANATPSSIITNNNTLTFGPSSIGFGTFTDAKHIVGNLQRTVTSTATVFPIGNGTATTGYAPVTLQFETVGSSQVVKVSSQLVNPTFGKGGDPTRAINALWTITPQGTAPTDNIAIDFGWGNLYTNGLAVGATTTFPAKWNGSSWTDYRSSYAVTPATSFTATNSYKPLAATFGINASALSGSWATFVAASGSDTDKDLAVSVSRNKLAIKNITPSTIEAGVPFTATVELQDQYGNGIVADTAVALTFTDVIDNGTATYPVGVIPVGSSSVVINGFAYTNASIGNQFKVTGAGKYLQDGISPTINVIGVLPSDQVNTIALTASTTSTTMTFALTSGSGIIIAKAGSAITSDDFPVDGVTYFASSNFGEGSKIGDAVVVYKGGVPSSAVTISGLAPNTTYYFRGFSYGAATAGTEKYLTFAAANNPKSVTTSGSSNNDDDTDYGTNNTMETAKPIGANSPIKGTIKTADDVDWFSFTITNSAPNLRARLTLLAALGNYNVELYNVDGRRLRRGTRLSNNVENQVINELEPGTYLVKISGVDGAYDPDDYYTLQLTTDGNEIFSVTE